MGLLLPRGRPGGIPGQEGPVRASFRAAVSKRWSRGPDRAQRRLESGGAGGGGRTLMPSEGRGILSPVRLPVPPLQQGFDSFEFTTFPARRSGSSPGRPEPRSSPPPGHDGPGSTRKWRRPYVVNDLRLLWPDVPPQLKCHSEVEGNSAAIDCDHGKFACS